MYFYIINFCNMIFDSIFTPLFTTTIIGSMKGLQVIQVWGLALCLSGNMSPYVLAQDMPSKADKQYEMGMYQQAADEYKRSIAEDASPSLHSYERLAECYLLTNDPYNAIMVYESAAMKFDMPAEAYISWASALKKIGKTEEANEILSFASIKSDVHIASIQLDDQVSYKVRSLEFNTAADEFAPAFHGDQLVFVSNQSMQSPQAKLVSNQLAEQPHILYRADIESGAHSRLRGQMRDYINDGPCNYSSDLSLVCFSKGHFPASQSPKLGNQKSGSIHIAEADASGDWQKIISLPCNELGVANIYPHLTSNGHRVYFASNREGGFGGFDIYYTDRLGDGWTSPVNAGDLVNSSNDEISPWTDGDMLYYASNRNSGFGGFDLYGFDAGKDKGPVNLGAEINSTWDDYALATKNQGQSGYFTSNRPGGAGGEDIYSFHREVRPAGMAATTNPTHTPKVIPTSTNIAASTESTQNDIAKSTTKINTASAEPTNYIPMQGLDVPVLTIADENTEPEHIQTIFTIQVAALSQANDAYKTIAARLQDIGFVYRVYYHNITKIRVGQFQTDQQARAVLEKVRSRGFSDAFVVREELVREDLNKLSPQVSTTNEKQAAASVQQSSANVASNQANTASTQSTTPTMADLPSSAQDVLPDLSSERMQEVLAQVTRYRIKLGSYTDMSSFDDTIAKRYGSVFKEQAGDWTKVFVGDYMTIEDADAVRVELAKQGYDKAIIYGVNKDTLVRVK